MSEEKQLIRKEVGAVSDPDGAGTDLPALVRRRRGRGPVRLRGVPARPRPQPAHAPGLRAGDPPVLRLLRRLPHAHEHHPGRRGPLPGRVGSVGHQQEAAPGCHPSPVRRAGHPARRGAEPGRQRAGAAAVGRGGADAGDHGAPGPDAAGERSHRLRGRAAGPGGDRRADLHGRPHRGRGPAPAAGLLPRRGAVVPALHRQGREEPRDPVPARPGPDAP